MVIGSIIAYPSGTIPENHLVCDGSAVSRTTYAELFDVIGETYGAGDGSTTFNLPNLSGRVAVGVASGYLLGATAGDETVTLQTTQIAAHNHSVGEHGHGNSITATTPKFTHSITQPTCTYTQLNGTANRWRGSNNKYSSRTSAAMTRSTNLSITAHAAAACTMSGSVTAKAAYDSGSAGTGGAHNNLMPYLALTYLIRYAPDEPPKPRMLIYNGAMPVTAQGYYLVGTKS